MPKIAATLTVLSLPGLHARPIAAIVKSLVVHDVRAVVTHAVYTHIGNRTVEIGRSTPFDGQSIMSMLCLPPEATQKGAVLTITIDGKEAESAYRSLAESSGIRTGDYSLQKSDDSDSGNVN